MPPGALWFGEQTDDIDEPVEEEEEEESDRDRLEGEATEVPVDPGPATVVAGNSDVQSIVSG